mgnify:FL=1
MSLLKVLSVENAIKSANKASWFIRRNRPLIETTLGLVTIGVSVKLAFDAKGKVDAITTDVEERIANGEEVKTSETVLRVGLAMAPSIVTFMCGTGLILDSTRVLTNRVNTLASALTVAHKENDRIKNYLKEKHPEVDTRPVEVTKKEVIDEEGNKTEVESVERLRPDLLRGFWFDASDYYERDNVVGMQALTVQTERTLYNKLMGKGYIELIDIYNLFQVQLTDMEKREIYGFGFTDTDFFDLEFNTNDNTFFDVDNVTVTDEDGRVQIPYVEWPTPRYILSSIDNEDDDLREYIY